MSDLWQSVKDYQNHLTVTLHSTVYCIEKRTKDQSERSFDVLLLLINISSAKLVEEPGKGRGSYLDELMLLFISCTASPRICDPFFIVSLDILLVKVNIYEKNIYH